MSRIILNIEMDLVEVERCTKRSISLLFATTDVIRCQDSPDSWPINRQLIKVSFTPRSISFNAAGRRKLKEIRTKRATSSTAFCHYARAWSGMQLKSIFNFLRLFLIKYTFLIYHWCLQRCRAQTSTETLYNNNKI